VGQTVQYLREALEALVAQTTPAGKVGVKVVPVAREARRYRRADLRGREEIAREALGARIHPSADLRGPEEIAREAWGAKSHRTAERQGPEETAREAWGARTHPSADLRGLEEIVQEDRAGVRKSAVRAAVAS